MTASSSGSLSASTSNERFGRGCVAPYGIAYVPPKGATAVVLPTEAGAMALGVEMPHESLEPGELMLYSAGGARIVLKNDGSVQINGRTV